MEGIAGISIKREQRMKSMIITSILWHILGF